jgi:chromosome partitioning protein
MQKIIAVINQKGGVGKSTTALALGAGFRARGFRVLLVDLDAQGNLSYAAGLEPEGPSAAELLLGGQFNDIVVRGTPFGDIIPSSSELASVELALTATGKEYRLREAFNRVKDEYDYIFLDTPPTLGIVTVNALTAASSAIIPALADVFSLQGIGQLYATIDAVRKYTNTALTIQGILITRFSSRTVISRDMVELLERTARELGTKVFETRIREAVAVREAQANRENIFEYAPKSTASIDYVALIEEIIN